jgi:hypothetical protein
MSTEDWCNETVARTLAQRLMSIYPQDIGYGESDRTFALLLRRVSTGRTPTQEATGKGKKRLIKAEDDDQ